MLQVSVCTDNTTCLLQINHRGMQLYSDSTLHLCHVAHLVEDSVQCRLALRLAIASWLRSYLGLASRRGTAKQDENS